MKFCHFSGQCWIAIYRVGPKILRIFEFSLSTSVCWPRQPMQSPSALTELSPLNLTRLFSRPCVWKSCSDSIAFKQVTIWGVEGLREHNLVLAILFKKKWSTCTQLLMQGGQVVRHVAINNLFVASSSWRRLFFPARIVPRSDEMRTEE